MRSIPQLMQLIVGVLIAGTIAAGCARGARESDAGPISRARLEAIRQSIRASDPGAMVGMVTEVLPDRPFAAVRDVPLGEFRVGQPITILDASQRPVANGFVRRITPDELHVEYEPRIGGRGVRVGDVAVGFTR